MVTERLSLRKVFDLLANGFIKRCSPSWLSWFGGHTISLVHVSPEQVSGIAYSIIEAFNWDTVWIFINRIAYDSNGRDNDCSVTGSLEPAQLAPPFFNPPCWSVGSPERYYQTEIYFFDMTYKDCYHHLDCPSRLEVDVPRWTRVYHIFGFSYQYIKFYSTVIYIPQYDLSHSLTDSYT